ncbi:MAG: phosphotransferase family protein [Sphingobium sp.]
MTAACPPEPLGSTIEAFVRARVPTGADAFRYKLLSGGNSHITWRVETGGNDGDLVVKIAQPDGPLAPYDVAHEGEMMAQAHAAGVPAPALIGHLQDGDLQFLVMRAVEGEAPSIWEVQNWLADRPDTDRIGIGRSLLSILPALADATQSRARQSDIYAAYLDGLVHNLEEATAGVMVLPPTIRAAQSWLIDRLPQMEAPPTLCHGDFRIGNAVFRDGGIVAMLDWERAMTGHPLHDLGFLCLPGMRVGDRICGVLTQDELAEAWLAITGDDLDLKAAAYFKIVAIFGEICLMVRALARLATGNGRLTGVRPLPLVANLHRDLVKSIRRWDNGDFNL